MSYPAGRTRWHLDGDGATDDDGNSDGATDDDDDDNDVGDDCDSAAAADDDVNDNDDHNDGDDVDDVDDHNLPPRVGKRNDCCDETKPEEEGTVADSVAIHTTIKQITGRGGGRWQRDDDDVDEGNGHDNNGDDGGYGGRDVHHWMR
jgi:hypothetical protein